MITLKRPFSAVDGSSDALDARAGGPPPAKKRRAMILRELRAEGAECVPVRHRLRAAGPPEAALHVSRLALPALLQAKSTALDSWRAADACRLESKSDWEAAACGAAAASSAAAAAAAAAAADASGLHFRDEAECDDEYAPLPLSVLSSPLTLPDELSSWWDEPQGDNEADKRHSSDVTTSSSGGGDSGDVDAMLLEALSMFSLTEPAPPLPLPLEAAQYVDVAATAPTGTEPTHVGEKKAADTSGQRATYHPPAAIADRVRLPRVHAIDGCLTALDAEWCGGCGRSKLKECSCGVRSCAACQKFGERFSLSKARQSKKLARMRRLLSLRLWKAVPDSMRSKDWYAAVAAAPEQAREVAFVRLQWFPERSLRSGRRKLKQNPCANLLLYLEADERLPRRSLAEVRLLLALPRHLLFLQPKQACSSSPASSSSSAAAKQQHYIVRTAAEERRTALATVLRCDADLTSVFLVHADGARARGQDCW